MHKFFDRLGVLMIFIAVPTVVWAIWDWSWLPVKVLATIMVAFLVFSYLAMDDDGNYPD